MVEEKVARRSHDGRPSLQHRPSVALEHDQRAVVSHRSGVVAGAEHGDDLVVVVQLEALGHALVRAHDQVQRRVQLEELLRDIGPKKKARPPGRLAAAALAGRVRPHSLLEQRSRRRNLVESVDGCDVGQSGRLAEQAAVDHEHLLLDDVDDGQRGEAGAECVENFRSRLARIFLQTLLLESVAPVDVARLVVAAVQEHVVRQQHLPRKQRQDALHRVLPAVDEVAVEDEAGARGRKALQLEDGEKVVQLTVQITDIKVLICARQCRLRFM